ncbi:MAG TPA: helix-turn-helix domain-containing protein [Puia sp.]|nr:helix-turn-helix domain-containing protein [Puia sp.]
MKKKMVDWVRSLFRRKSAVRTASDQEFVAADYILHRLDLYMAEKRPFLQPRYTLKQLSEAIKIPAYQVSAIINLRKGVNFTDYLNKLRIRHCEQLIKIAGDKKLNIPQLASACGFHNRNTFTTAFKKFTGMTPSEYLRQHI